MTQSPGSTSVTEAAAGAILLLRGQRVILDSRLAELYGVEVRALPQAVKRNSERFPADFMFQLQNHEVTRLRSQFVISNGRGGRRYSPYAFTEQGVAMLSSVLRSRRAVLVNVEIMRARRVADLYSRSAPPDGCKAEERARRNRDE